MNGIGVAPGIALARPLILDGLLSPVRESCTDPSAELALLTQLRQRSIDKMNDTIERVERQYGPKESEVFEAQLMLLDNDELWDDAAVGVKGGKCAQWAFSEAIQAREEMFAHLDNAYLQERSADLRDLEQLVLGLAQHSGADCCEGLEVILVGSEVSPSRLTDPSLGTVVGAVMEQGGATSHAAILANMLGIPCLIGAAGILEAAKQASLLLIDGDAGSILLDPDEESCARARQAAAALRLEQEKDASFIGKPSRSKDGATIGLQCNIASPEDAEGVIQCDGEGVGLLRSEFLYLGRDAAPSEEEQFRAYTRITSVLGDRPLIIRTLDIGGDKQTDYIHIGPEENPFLGCRAIRYCLKHPDLFLVQLRAILRAGAVGNVLMMFPMIAVPEELTQALAYVRQAKEELAAEGVPFDGNMKIGMMVEIPSAALMAETFAQQVDFFSIGTNDLTQYLFSADRGNPQLSHLNDPFAPVLLRTIADVVGKAHKAGIFVDICGQAGQEELLLPLWLAMGIDALSVSSKRLLRLRRRLSFLQLPDCRQLLQRALSLQTAAEVRALLAEYASL